MMTILVIDDEEGIRDLMRVVLENRDCRVLEASDGETGLELARREHPDLVLLDCRMSGLSGSEVLKRLRAEERTAATPVILMSGIEDDDTAQVGRHLHADGYLLKPFRPVQLLEEIQHVLHTHVSAPAANQAAA